MEQNNKTNDKKRIRLTSTSQLVTIATIIFSDGALFYYTPLLVVVGSCCCCCNLFFLKEYAKLRKSSKNIF